MNRPLRSISKVNCTKDGKVRNRYWHNYRVELSRL